MTLSVLVLAAVVLVSAKQTEPPASAGAAVPVSAATEPVEATGDAPTPEELHEEAILRERRRVQRTHRVLGISTWTGVVTTQALTTAIAVNQRTLFGPGACSTSPTASTDPGCSPALQGIRDFTGLISQVFYASTAMYALSMLRFDRMGASSGRSRVALEMHKGTVYLHLAAMVLLPILSFLTENPQVLGFSTNSSGLTAERTASFQSAMRSVHLVVGFVAVGALTTAMILEF